MEQSVLCAGGVAVGAELAVCRRRFACPVGAVLFQRDVAQVQYGGQQAPQAGGGVHSEEEEGVMERGEAGDGGRGKSLLRCGCLAFI